jgi:hypothetical protein
MAAAERAQKISANLLRYAQFQKRLNVPQTLAMALAGDAVGTIDSERNTAPETSALDYRA